MAEIKYLANLDLSKNQLLNAVVQNLAVAPSSPEPGQIYWNTADDTLYVWNQADQVWMDLGSDGITNLGYTAGVSNGVVTSDTGSNATIPLANGTNAGLMSAAEKSKLASIEDNAKNDQTASEVSSSSSGNLTSTNVQSALVELQGDIDGLEGASNTLSITHNASDVDVSIENDLTGNSSNITLDEATTLVAGALSSAKFDEIVANTLKETNVSTNISVVENALNVSINSSDGLNDTIAGVSGTLAGVMLPAQKTKLDGIEAGAEVNEQADWDVVLSSDDAFIKNKPNVLYVVATTGDLPTAATAANDNALVWVDAENAFYQGTVTLADFITTFADTISWAEYGDLASDVVTSLALSSNILTYTDEAGNDTDIDLSLYLDDSNLARLTSGSINSSTGLATFTRDDNSTFTIDMSAFLDAITLNNTLTSTSTTEGLPAAQGKVLKDLIDAIDGTFVDLTSAQTITGAKTFDGAITATDDATFNSLYIGTDDNTVALDPNDALYLLGDSGVHLESGDGVNVTVTDTVEVTGTTALSVNSGTLSFGNLTATRNFAFPDTAGTVALTSNIPTNSTFVDLTTNQTIAGEKTFDDNASYEGDVTVYGDVVVDGGKIDLANTDTVVNVVDPTNAQDVATKNYVDNNVFDGAYGSLTGTPTIPTNNNQLTNGANYLTSVGWDELSGSQDDISLSGFDNDLTILQNNTAGTSTTINHSLGQYVDVSIFKATTPFNKVEAQVECNSTNVVVTFNSSQTAGAYKIKVSK
jgi:hypothetical protein